MQKLASIQDSNLLNLTKEICGILQKNRNLSQHSFQTKTGLKFKQIHKKWDSLSNL